LGGMAVRPNPGRRSHILNRRNGSRRRLLFLGSGRRREPVSSPMAINRRENRLSGN
jgi:hypothetical protein